MDVASTTNTLQKPVLELPSTIAITDTKARDDEALFQQHLGDREWRINNLYYIKDSSGRKVKFKMNPVQKQLHDNLHFRNVIPKARKLGVSTFFAILNLDQMLFSKNKTAGIISHRQEDMKKLFRNTILFAVENLEPWIKDYIGKTDTATANELTFANGSNIFVSLTTRGNTPQFLHISELGYIDKHSPDKAEEIIGGSINSVSIGAGNVISIESTADNGRNGAFHDICMSAERLRTQNIPLTELDWKIFFFAWYKDPQYQLHDADFVTISPEMVDYFKKVERETGTTLSLPQQRWYVKQRETNREKMFSQYPSTLEEAFSVSLEGSYYGNDVTEVYGSNRIGFFPVDPLYTVDVAFDLGMNDSTVMIFFQSIGPEIRIIDLYESSGVGLAHYVEVLRKRGYRYGRYILPHDVNVRDLGTGVTRLELLWSLGLRNTVVARKAGINDGIEKVRLLFRRFRFDKEKAQGVLDALQIYRKKWDDKKGVWMDTPLHDQSSHIADAIRTLAVEWNENFLYDETTTEEQGRGGVQTISFFGQ